MITRSDLAIYLAIMTPIIITLGGALVVALQR